MVDIAVLVSLQALAIIFLNNDDSIPDEFFAYYSFMGLFVWLKAAFLLRFTDEFNFFLR
jgi:uncharacterized membrane protein